MPEQTYIISTFNLTDEVTNDPHVLTENYTSEGILKPRDNIRLFIRPFNKDTWEPWSLPISLFKDFKDDHKELED